MVVKNHIKQPTLLEEFNLFFKGSAEATIDGNRLEITIGSQTLIVSFPVFWGFDSMGQSKQS